MSLLDKFSNPVWYKVEQLQDGAKWEVCFFILLPGFFRSAIGERLIAPFERLCDTSDLTALRRGREKITPLSSETRERLIDEALLGLLCSCRWPTQSADALKYLDVQFFSNGVGAFALAQMNARLGRDKPELLEASGYSQDPDEARTQVLLAWMKILQLTDAAFVEALVVSLFAEEWTGFVNAFLGGAYKGFSRTERSGMSKQSRAVCASLSPKAKAVMDYFVTKALTRFKRA